MRTMLTVPAPLVANFRSGLLGERGFAAEDRAGRALTIGCRSSESVYDEPLKAFDAARVGTMVYQFGYELPEDAKSASGSGHGADRGGPSEW